MLNSNPYINKYGFSQGRGDAGVLLVLAGAQGRGGFLIKSIIWNIERFEVKHAKDITWPWGNSFQN